MIALLRQAADPGSGEGAAWAGMRIHRVTQRRAGRTRLLLQAQRRVGVPDHAAGQGPRGGRRFPGASTVTTLGKRSTMDLSVLLEGV